MQSNPLDGELFLPIGTALENITVGDRVSYNSRQRLIRKATVHDEVRLLRMQMAINAERDRKYAPVMRKTLMNKVNKECCCVPKE